MHVCAIIVPHILIANMKNLPSGAQASRDSACCITLKIIIHVSSVVGTTKQAA